MSEYDDTWSTSDEYDPAVLVTRSTEQHGAFKGQTRPVRANIPPSYHAWMARVIQGAKIRGYETYADIIRDALYHRIWYHANNTLKDEGVRRVLRTEALISAAAERRQEMERLNDYVEAARENLALAQKSDDHMALEKELESLEDVLVEGDIRSPYREQVEKLIARYREGK